MNTHANRSALARAIECWNAGRLDDYLAIYDPAIVLHGYPGVDHGLDSVRRFYVGFLGAFPDARLLLHDVLAVDDKVVCRFQCIGTHRGPFMGVPATGKPVDFTGITVLRFAGGKCIERWSHADFLKLLQQIGALPAPA
jgi:steroid delta-isomerase-like uncharacterized protein